MANKTEHRTNSHSFSVWLAVIPIPLFLISITILHERSFNNQLVQAIYEPPYLFPILNTIFIFLISCLVSYIAVKSYSINGSTAILLLGCGVLVLGTGSFLAGWVNVRWGANATVTIHNISALLSAIFHGFCVLASVDNTAYENRTSRRMKNIITAYSIAIVIVLFVSFLTINQNLPHFFTERGPTPLRQGMVTATCVLFFTSTFYFGALFIQRKNFFFIWYSLALALLSVNHLAILLQPSVGSPMGWLGRSAQYVAGVYFLVAVIGAFRDAKTQGMFLARTIADLFGNQGIHWQNVFTAINDAVVISDKRGIIVYANQAAERMFDYADSKMQGLQFHTLLCNNEQDYFVNDDLQKSGFREIELQKKNRHSFTGEISFSKSAHINKEFTTFVIRDISERKRASESALIESQEALKNAQAIARLGSWHLDILHNKIHWSDETYRIFGILRQNNITYESFLHSVHPDDVHIITERWSDMLNGTPHKLEYRILVDGEVKWVCSTGNPERDREGSIIGIFGTVQDITQRIQTELALKKQEESLKAAQSLAHIGSWEWDIVQNTASWSDETFRIFGIHPGALAVHRENFLSMIHPDDKMRVGQALSDAISGTRVYDLEYRIVLSDGSEKIIHAIAQVIRATDGSPTLMRGTVHDITERKLGENALKNARDEWERTFDAIAHPVMIVNTHHEIIKANKAMAQKLNLTPSEVKGLTCYKAVHGATVPPMLCPHAKFLSDTLPHTAEIYDKQLGGYFFISVSPLYDSTGKPYGSVHVLRDISEQKKAAELLRVSEERLRLAVESTGFGTYDYDFISGNVFYSREMLSLFGLPADTMTTQSNDLLFSIVHPDDKSALLATLEESYNPSGPGILIVEYRIIRPDKTIRWIRVRGRTIFSGDGERSRPLRANGIVQDITEYKKTEQERAVTIAFLQMVNNATGTHDIIQSAVTFFQKQSGCEAVGIRLKNDNDYPYYESRGFSKEFLLVENSLCLRDEEGQVIFDSSQNPVLSCMCGNVINGRTDASKPFFTAHGSFWSNCTTELLSSTTEADRQARTRNRCNGEGFESVALLPLRVGQENLGLLQLNDRRRDQFTAEIISIWEQFADYLAIAISKFKAQEANYISEKRYQGIVESQTEYVVRYLPGGILTYVNSAVAKMHKSEPTQLLGKSFFPFIHHEERAAMIDAIQSLTSENPVLVLETRALLPDVTVRWHQWTHRALFDEHGNFNEYQAVGRDITEQKAAEKTVREYTTRLVNMEEELRSKVAAELHDDIAQELAAVGINVSVLHDSIPKEITAKLSPRITDTEKLLQNISKSIRNIMAELRPPVIDDYGLEAALKWYSETFARRHGILISLHVDEQFPRLSSNCEIALFRICQEALANTAKHAKPKHVEIALRKDSSSILLSVSDDGQGFNTHASRQNSMFGLTIMRERAESIGGNLSLQSSPDQGTLISVMIPREVA